MKNRPIFWILGRIRRRIPAMLVMIAAQIGHSLLSVLFALGSRGVIDSAAARDPVLFKEACLYQLAIIIGILVCLPVMRHLRDKLNADMERDWKEQLLHGILHGDYSLVKGYHSAELLNRLNNDVRRVNDGILAVLPNAAAMLTRLAAAVTVLGVLDLRLTGCLLLVGVAAILATGVVRRYLKELNKRVSESDGKVSGFLQEIIEKLLMVQAMDVSDEVERRSGELLEERYQCQRRRKNVGVVVNTSIHALFQGIGFLALAWCAFRMLQGKMSFGSLTAIIQLVNQLQMPFANLSGVLPQYMNMVASAERLMELEDIQGEPAAMLQSPGDVYEKLEALTGENLCFAYEQDQVLNQASFRLPKHAFAVITGQSGTGKSTLLKLLLGIFKPQSGVMYFQCADGSIQLDRTTRRMFAYVPQGNLLLSGTLRDNLLIVRPGASEEEIRLAVYASAMDEYLPGLPHGLDTPLGESGAGLSEGQAQRLAIARAVLSGAPILLLDECTSALDEATEKLVLQRLKALPERTCIAVTHRPAAIALCDWQLDIAEGKIVTVRCGAGE